MLQINEQLVSAEWLRDNLSRPNLKLLDASHFMPGSERSGKGEWLERRIPGAIFFDFDGEIRDQQASLPHMLPSADAFSEAAGKLGISNDDAIVVYDSQGIFSAPRVWWMFKIMGHHNVAVLNGGLPAWLEMGGELDTELPAPLPPAQYHATFHPERVIDAERLLQGIEAGSLNLIDVRPASRFHGEVAEPRAGIRSGHMPSAKNLPFAELLENGHYKGKPELKSALQPVLCSDKPNVSSCGSGVTACILALAAEEALGTVVTVYDGSWTEWGGNPELPVVKD